LDWQLAAWNALRAAAAARDQEQKARLQEERNSLWQLLYGRDTLTLRRLEREELVRLVLQWMLGPSDPALADSVVDQVLQQMRLNERAFQIPPDPPAPAPKPPLLPTFDRVDDNGWYRSLLFGDFVKFVQQAVEWENL